MIESQKVCSWIENKHDITLFPSQKRFLEGLIHGFDVNCPRGFGRTSLTKWYTEYLNEVYANKLFSYEADIMITASERAAEDSSFKEFFNGMKKLFGQASITEIDRFRREYVCEFE